MRSTAGVARSFALACPVLVALALLPRADPRAALEVPSAHDPALDDPDGTVTDTPDLPTPRLDPPPPAPPEQPLLAPAPEPPPAAAPVTRTSAAEDRHFPRPAKLAPAVAFWKRVYLEVATDGGFVHDAEVLSAVFEVIHFDDVKSERARQRQVDGRREFWRALLDDLRHERASGEEAARVADLYRRALGREPTARDYGLARNRIRFQLGQRDKFRSGLIASGAWEDAMRDVFRREGLPEDLAYLPHVESSFNVHAYSKYGAAGPWQFMRSTGRRFLRIDYVVDERLDPMASTRAATRLLAENYRVLGTWPLALTAYNHGTGGMARAKRRLGTDRIEEIVESYQSRTFGFASRNFYAQFLAAREILRSHESYFGPIRRDAPEPVDEVILPFFADVHTLEANLGVGPEAIHALNPALRPPVFRSGKRIPRGFALRLPAGTVGADAQAWLANVPAEERHAQQRHADYYQVSRGDTLGRIATRHGVSLGALLAANDLGNRRRIYPGQLLQSPELPGSRRSQPTLVASATAATLPAPKPVAPPALPKPEPVAPEPTPAEPPTPEIAAVAVEDAAPPVEPEDADAVGAVEPGTGEAEESATPEVIALVEPADSADAAGAAVAVPGVSAESPWRRIENDAVMVDALETLGHFAEWLELPAQRLRNLNDLSPRRPLRLGQRIRLDFSRVPRETFLERRLEYHKGVEEDFFGSWRVTGTESHRLKPGESLWALAQKRGVPIWLIHRYNPDVDLTRLVPGANVELPLVEKLGGA